MKGRSLLQLRFNTDSIENTFKNVDPSITKEQLKSMENEEEEIGRINWEAWDRVCEQTKKDINDFFERTHYKEPERKRGRYLTKYFVYDSNGKLVCSGNAVEIKQELGMSAEQIRFSAKKQHYHIHRKLWFSYFKETPQSIRKQIEMWKQKPRKPYTKKNNGQTND